MRPTTATALDNEIFLTHEGTTVQPDLHHTIVAVTLHKAFKDFKKMTDLQT